MSASDMLHYRHQAILKAMVDLGQQLERGHITREDALINATLHQARATLVLADEVRLLRKQLEGA